MACLLVQIHMMTQYALCALSAGRVMLWGRRIGIRYTDPVTCGPGVESWLCHVLPPSSCTLDQVGLSVASPLVVYVVLHPVPFQAEAAGADTITVYDAYERWFERRESS